ncbi:Hypothetical_protein [Hexamita inflata]|uniref:Hypothetical_protein n=1 Tax=Hexamita inflata TaxID=28002 RepID=A0AA86TCW2_9EUKA|nr:Hypothetical protein HINF_LOCUS542 [Hexamita inflata]
MTIKCFKHNERQQKQWSQRSEDNRISIQSIHYEIESGSNGSFGKLVLPSMQFRSRIVFANCHRNQTAEAKLKTTQRSRKNATSNAHNIHSLLCERLPIFEDLFWRRVCAMIIETRLRLEWWMQNVPTSLLKIWS